MSPVLSFHRVAEIRIIRTFIKSERGPNCDFETVKVMATDDRGEEVELLLYMNQPGIGITESKE